MKPKLSHVSCRSASKHFVGSCLSLCLLALTGCDNSHSPSASNNTASTQMSSFSSVQKSDETNEVIDVESNIESEDEGQSLIASARPTEISQAKRTMLSNGDSELQAILMGDYGGILPCTFCDDIEVTLNLFADSTVVKTSVYNNPEVPRASLIESGVYRQDSEQITIAYDNRATESYYIQDNHLLKMDNNKNVDDNHSLSRQ